MSIKKIYDRRSALKFLGLSSAGIAVATAVGASARKLASGDFEKVDNSNQIQRELEELKLKYYKLDKRSRLILKALFFVTGINFFI